MRIRNLLLQVGKLAVAVAAIVAVAWLPAQQLTPSLSLFELAAWVLIAVVAIVAIAVVSLQVAQLVLRLGGTDAQWLWFGREPPGLEAQRGERRWR